MSKRRIHHITVIGSGIMGSGIACHFANIGVKVLLLDIAPGTLTAEEQQKGLTLDSPAVKNRIVNTNLKKALASNPSPIYHKKFASRITTGNLTDNLPDLAAADWIIEVIVERLDIKKNLFEKIEKHRTPGTLVTSNTSGIPIHFMSEGRSEDFRKHFCGTHFFNPPRYLKLFEIIPGPDTTPEVLQFLNQYGERYLGKTAIIAKDTPAFIGNRIGIFSIMSLFHHVKEMNLTIEEVDKLTGPVIGRPKKATFRTIDVVGLDTLVHVANGIAQNCKEDENRALFNIPPFINTMLENNRLGSKTGEGFYKKTGSGDTKEILALDLDTMDYRPMKKVSFPTLKTVRSIPKISDRFKELVAGKDKAGEFYRKNFSALFAYVSNRVPEITESLYKIDNAMKAGFGWEHGPFQLWDAIGVKEAVTMMQAEGETPAPWIEEMLHAGITSFYTLRDGVTWYYDSARKEYRKMPGQDAFIILDNLRETRAVFKNNGVVVHHLGDGILNVEFRSKMNTIDGDVLDGLNSAFDLAEKEYNGLIVGNQAANFSVGANIEMIFLMAAEQEYGRLNKAVKYFQDTMMRMRYSAIPTISAPHGMALGGACEMSMHADKVVAAAETYIGLVEFGVGVIPGGAGTKEMTVRAADTFKKDDVELNVLREYFLTIGMAKVATSAYEAYDLGILQKGKDVVVVNKDRQIALAKQHALLLAENGYTQPIPRTDIKVLGKQALGMFLAGTDAMKAGNYISEHDKKIANKLAWVMAGGDLSEATLVSEEYLLELEREAFLSLCTERKTLERIEHMLKTGKPLRN